MQVDNNSYCGFDLPVKNREIESLFAEIERRHPQVKFIDPQVVQCKNDRCVGNIDGIPIYRDKGHITDHASQEFGERYLEKYDNPLRP